MSGTVEIPEKIISRIKAMLDRTTDRGFTEAEASAAADKVAEILAVHNISMSDIEAHGGEAGKGAKRERSSSARSANYAWQITLMRAVAKLNFCHHWVDKTTSTNTHGETVHDVKRHFLIGRAVNVAASNLLYDYLCGAIVRVMPDDCKPHRSKRGSSFTIGCADRLATRLDYEHWRVISEAKAKKKADAERRAASGSNEPGALVISDVYSSEEDLNWDALMNAPAGTTARRRAEYERKQAEAAANPQAKPAAREETPAEKAKREKADAKWYAKYERDQAKARAKIDQGAYAAGQRIADDISLDRQITAESRKSTALSVR